MLGRARLPAAPAHEASRGTSHAARENGSAIKPAAPSRWSGACPDAIASLGRTLTSLGAIASRSNLRNLSDVNHDLDDTKKGLGIVDTKLRDLWSGIQAKHSSLADVDVQGVKHCFIGKLYQDLYPQRPKISFLLQYWKRPKAIASFMAPLLACRDQVRPGPAAAAAAAGRPTSEKLLGASAAAAASRRPTVCCGAVLDCGTAAPQSCGRQMRGCGTASPTWLRHCNPNNPCTLAAL